MKKYGSYCYTLTGKAPITVRVFKKMYETLTGKHYFTMTEKKAVIQCEMRMNIDRMKTSNISSCFLFV